MWLIGGVESVSAMTETFIKERELQDEPGKTMPGGHRRACAFLVRFKNGAIGTFESTRYARGRKNFNTFEVNGAQAAIVLQLEEAHKLLYYDHTDDQRGARLARRAGDRQRPPVHEPLWVPGCVIGTSTLHQRAGRLPDGLDTGVPAQPDFRCALENPTRLRRGVGGRRRRGSG